MQYGLRMRIGGTSAGDLCKVVVRQVLRDVTVYTVGSCGVITHTTQCIRVGLQRRLFEVNNATALSKANIFLVHKCASDTKFILQANLACRLLHCVVLEHLYIWRNLLS